MAKWLPGNHIWAVKMSSVEVYDSNGVQHPIFNNMTFFFPSTVYGTVRFGTFIVTPETVHTKLRECGFIGTEFATPYIVTRLTPTGEAAQLISIIPQIFPLWKGHIAIPNAGYICNRDNVSGIVTNCFFNNNYAYGQGFDGSISLTTPALMGFHGMLDSSASAELWIPAYSSPDSSTTFASMHLFRLWIGTNNNLYLSIHTGFNGNASAAIQWRWWNALNSDFPITNPDPFSPGGTSGTGGGGMTGDPPPHDSVDFPITPSTNALNAGFISIWTPSEEQVQSLSAWLWTTDLTKIATWQKLIQNPLDLIFGLSIVPVPIHHTDDDTPATEEEIVALNDPMTLGWIDTGIGIDWITEQYVEIDCGSIDMDEYWNAYLDYAPYTKMSIYLPYIGVKELNVNDCMNRTISLLYKIDLASGSCVAIIKCDDSVYYHFGGNCASSIPITATQMQEVIRNAVTTAVAVGATAAAVGSGAAPTVIAASAGASAASAARSVMSGVDYHRSGANGGTTGLMSVQTPYLILTRPRQAVPENQNTYTGYPSFITEQIGDLTGYTEVEIIHMHNLTCTSEEFEEIDELLLKGVII